MSVTRVFEVLIFHGSDFVPSSKNPVDRTDSFTELPNDYVDSIAPAGVMASVEHPRCLALSIFRFIFFIGDRSNVPIKFGEDADIVGASTENQDVDRENFTCMALSVEDDEPCEYSPLRVKRC
jgi:hypothetical protein